MRIKQKITNKNDFLRDDWTMKIRTFSYVYRRNLFPRMTLYPFLITYVIKFSIFFMFMGAKNGCVSNCSLLRENGNLHFLVNRGAIHGVSKNYTHILVQLCAFWTVFHASGKLYLHRSPLCLSRTTETPGWIEKIYCSFRHSVNCILYTVYYLRTVKLIGKFSCVCVGTRWKVINKEKF
jgi:hypothetical protein